MASDIKTKRTKASVAAFVNKIQDVKRRADVRLLLKLYKEATKEKPSMWGSAIVGYGTYHYYGAGGREGDWMISGFSPRKQNLTVYVMLGTKSQATLLKQLGKHSVSGGSCIYIKRLSDIDMKILKKIVETSHSLMKKKMTKQMQDRKPLKRSAKGGYLA